MSKAAIFLRNVFCHFCCSYRAVNSGYIFQLLMLTCTLTFFVKESHQLRIIKFDVPSAKANGSSATLHCNYDLDEGEELYSVKLYHEHEEFYRYMPKDDPPAQWFKSPGIYVQGTRSNATHVVLHRTDLNSDGLYACEVSTEAPAFATRKNEKMMKIYVLPQETLTIQGGRDYYRINEHVNFVCISGKGWPLLQLRWFINDAPAPDDFLTTFKAKPDENGLLRSKLGLNFRATRDYFRSEHLRLRCAAALTLLYELKAVEYLIDGTKKHRANGKRFTNDLAQINSKDVPVISGIREKYNVNETINLNCSTTAPRADLAWYINGHRVNNSHLRTFSASGKTASMTVLGVRLQMEKRFFQTEEIELKCVASFAKTIADFQEQVIIKTFNSENFLLERSSPSSAASSISQASSSKSLICSTLSLLLNFIFFFSNFQPFSCKTTTRRLKCWIAELALIRFKDFSIYSNDTL